MVVVVLIGIIVSFIVRSVGDGGRQERILREVQRLNALVELVGEESIIKSAVIGLRFERSGYLFVLHDGNKWLEVEKDDLLKPHQLDGMMEMELLVEGYSVDLEQVIPEEVVRQKGPQPQVVFLPSGERTPFELALRFRDDESGYRLEVPPLGLVERHRLEAR